MRERADVTIVAVMLSLIAMTTGCSVLPPSPDSTQFYVLTALTADSTTSASSATSHLAIGLGPVKLPAYLEHPEVVTRVASNRLDLSPNDRWAEPLDESFRRILAINLGGLLGTNEILAFPWDLSTPVDYKIEVNVGRFERDGSGGTQLLGDWVIRDGRSNRVLMSRQASFAENTGTGMEGAAAALSADLSDLSKQIADAVTELNQRQTRAAN